MRQKKSILKKKRAIWKQLQLICWNEFRDSNNSTVLLSQKINFCLSPSLLQTRSRTWRLLFSVLESRYDTCAANFIWNIIHFVYNCRKTLKFWPYTFPQLPTQWNVIINTSFTMRKLCAIVSIQLWEFASFGILR